MLRPPPPPRHGRPGFSRVHLEESKPLATRARVPGRARLLRAARLREDPACLRQDKNSVRVPGEAAVTERLQDVPNRISTTSGGRAGSSLPRTTVDLAEAQRGKWLQAGPEALHWEKRPRRHAPASAHTGELGGSPGQDPPGSCQASQAHSPDSGPGTPALSWRTHDRDGTVSRNCFVTDLPGAGSCPGGCWWLPWRQPVGLGQRGLSSPSASQPTPSPGPPRPTSPAPEALRLPQTQAATGWDKEGLGPARVSLHPGEPSWQQTALTRHSNRNLWAVYWVPGPCRGQQHDPHLRGRNCSSETHASVQAHSHKDVGLGH